MCVLSSSYLLATIQFQFIEPSAHHIQATHTIFVAGDPAVVRAGDTRRPDMAATSRLGTGTSTSTGVTSKEWGGPTKHGRPY